jgi:DNA-binding winged helix-turn-helix (wHTH) protein
LNKAINKLRDALCDSAENPRFVETLARRGYHFLAPVQFQDPEEKHSENSGSSPAVISADASVGQTVSGLMTTKSTTILEAPGIEAEPAANPLPWSRRHIWTIVLFG